jgi:2,3-dihydroxybenzoate decarboxylase
VTRLGFKGAMIHGLANGVFLDDRRFWPIFERAQALDVPLYMHPAPPHPAVVEAYYKEYAKEFPGLLTAGWGFTVETATQAIRLVLSGVFEAYPALKIILGHLGEGLPFSLWRIDMALARQGNRRTPFRDCFREHFWITTSGNFSTPALLCCMLEMGIDRILFSVDYPFVLNPPGMQWMRELPLGAEDRAKVLGGNARRLLKL